MLIAGGTGVWCDLAVLAICGNEGRLLAESGDSILVRALPPIEVGGRRGCLGRVDDRCTGSATLATFDGGGTGR